MRQKNVRYWIDFNPSILQKIKRLQSVWRGYSVRNRLRLAGKGVLKRSICHNDDEMVTSESKTEVHPFDYFSIEDDGRVWWFDQKSIIEWSQTNLTVTNPFTRHPFTQNDMNRLNRLIYIRRSKRLPLVHNKKNLHTTDIDQLCDKRWMRVVQIMREMDVANTVHPNHFRSLDCYAMVVFVETMILSTRVWMYQNINVSDSPFGLRSKRSMIYSILKALRGSISIWQNVDHVSYDVAGALIIALNEINDRRDFVYMVLTALSECGVVATGL